MYKLNVSGHHLKSGDEIQSLVKEKMDNLQRVNQQITTINVTLNSEKHATHEVIAEAKVHIPGHELFATAKSDKQLSTALDMLVNKLEKQLVKHKARHPSGRVHHMTAEDVESQSEKENQAEFNELVEREVIK
jgi:putative sigma-54 modulation protein